MNWEDVSTPEELEIRDLKSQVTGLQVNRDSLFDENTRFRADLNEKDEKIIEAEATCKRVTAFCEQVQRELKELRSEHEGKMDEYHEIVYQLQQQVRTLEAEISRQLKRANSNEGLCIVLVQLSGDRYFWVLVDEKEQLARSRSFDTKEVMEKEADALATQLLLPVIVSERSQNGKQ